MIRAVIFDCFGVLLGGSYWDIYRAAGGDPIKDDEFIWSMLDKLNSGRITSDTFTTIMTDRLGISYDEYHKITAQMEQPNKRLLEYVRKELKPKVKLAIMSNANVGALERKFAPEDLAMFDLKLVSAEIGLMKPDPRFFQMAADKLDAFYNEIVFVDDLERFTEPAAELGLNSILYKDFESFKTRLEELLKT